jgi:hypothetical protein
MKVIVDYKNNEVIILSGDEELYRKELPSNNITINFKEAKAVTISNTREIVPVYEGEEVKEFLKGESNLEINLSIEKIEDKKYNYIPINLEKELDLFSATGKEA